MQLLCIIIMASAEEFKCWIRKTATWTEVQKMHAQWDQERIFKTTPEPEHILLIGIKQMVHTDSRVLI